MMALIGGAMYVAFAGGLYAAAHYGWRAWCKHGPRLVSRLQAIINR